MIYRLWWAALPLNPPWTTLNVTWQFSESCSRSKHGRLCSLAQTLKSLEEKIKLIGRSGDFSLAWPVTWIIDCLSPLATRSFFTTVFLAVWLVKFPLTCFQRSVLDNPLHYIIDSVYTETLFLAPDICFRVFNYGKVKRTFVSQLLRTSANISADIS